MMRVLLADVDPAYKNAVTPELEDRGFLLKWVRSGREAIAAHRSAHVVVVRLDLPDLDGIEVCRRIRCDNTVPLIGIGPCDSEFERVLALRSGLDVCLAPSFGVRELVARIEALTRRGRPQWFAGPRLSYGELEIDGHARRVRLRGAPVGLTRKEFDLLFLLASRPDVTVDRRQILSAVWDDDHAWMLNSRTIDTHISSIRRKLGGEAAIRTQRGIGFRFSYRAPAAELMPAASG